MSDNRKQPILKSTKTQMKRIVRVGLLGLLASGLSCTDKTPKEAATPEVTSSTARPGEYSERATAAGAALLHGASAADFAAAVVNATQKLNQQPNYAWTTSTKEADGSAGRLGRIEGKAEKDGVTSLSFTVGGIVPVEVCLKGEKGAAKAMSGWQTFDEIAQEGGTPATIVRILRSYQTPAVESAGLAVKVKELKAAGGVIAGELSEDAVIEQLLAGSRKREGQAPPQTTDAKGVIKFWIKDGALTKYELQVQGKVTAGDRQSDINRTTTVEIKGVGSTKLEVPAAAKEKLG
jgi:hypothetical protein